MTPREKVLRDALVDIALHCRGKAMHKANDAISIDNRHVPEDAADAIPDAPVAECQYCHYTFDDQVAVEWHQRALPCTKPIPSRAELIELMCRVGFANGGDSDSAFMGNLLDALVKVGAVR